MKGVALPLAVIGAAVLLPAASWADSVCGPNGERIGGGQCITFSGGSASLQTTVVPASTMMAIQGFNPALGTLDEVDCENCVPDENGGMAEMTITVTNLNPFPQPFQSETGSMVLNVGTPSGAAGWIIGQVQFFCSVGPLDPGASQTTDCFSPGIDFADFSLVSPRDLASFISTGKVFAPVGVDSVLLPNFAFDFPADIVTFDSASVNVNVDLAYLYTPTQIPEPASGVLLLTAALIFGPLLRNRKRRFI